MIDLQVTGLYNYIKQLSILHIFVTQGRFGNGFPDSDLRY